MLVIRCMMKFSTLWASVVLILFSGCTSKNYAPAESKLVILKTKKLKFNDLAYIRYDGDAIQMDLYTVGTAVERLEIDSLICVSEGCMRKSSFNDAYLSAYYPDTILQNILLSRVILNGEGMRDVCSGFVQKIKSEHYDITYKVSKNETSFKDRKNKILIKIKRVKQ